MYKVLKPQGYGATVTLENTDTKASLIIGKISVDIIELLKSTHDPLNALDTWEIEVNSDEAKALAALTMKMKKPIRDQSKKDKKPEGRIGVEVDAFDLIYGIS